MTSTDMQDMLEELKCPVCKTLLKPPITLCVSGHSICEACFNDIQKCPVCEKKSSNMRNYTLENVIALLELPCQYYVKGCDFRDTLEPLLKHEDLCCYRNRKCPIFNCTWKGSLDKLMAHCESHHEVFNSSVLLQICFDEDQMMKRIIRKDNQIFVVSIEIHDIFAKVYVCHMKNDEEPSKFHYRICIPKKEQSIIFGAPCSLLCENQIDPNYVKMIIDSNAVLEYFTENKLELTLNVYNKSTRQKRRYDTSDD